jgi:hypothetical protein
MVVEAMTCGARSDGGAPGVRRLPVVEVSATRLDTVRGRWFAASIHEYARCRADAPHASNMRALLPLDASTSPTGSGRE